MTRSFDAMTFARQLHAGQVVQRFAGGAYLDHLAMTAGTVATVGDDFMVAVAWLHGSVQYCGVAHNALVADFGAQIARGVILLSDLEPGTPQERAAASRERLAAATGWIQTIRVASLISELASRASAQIPLPTHDLGDHMRMLEALSRADTRLVRIALAQLECAP